MPTAISGRVDISEVHGCHLLRQMGSQLGSQKLLQGFVSQDSGNFSVRGYLPSI